MMALTGEGLDTLAALFAARVAATPDARAYAGIEQGQWRSYTWREAEMEVGRVRAGLARTGLLPGDRIGICAYNSPRWIFCDLGALSLGLTVVPLFFNDRPENIAYCVQDAGVRLLFVDSPPPPELLTCNLKGIVSLKEVPGVLSLEHWLPPSEHVPPMACQDPHSLATIVYTSGTTGRPKGVMLSHKNILANVEALLQAIPEVAAGNHRFLSFLPLSHMLERTVGQYVAIAMGAETVFSRGITELGADLRLAKPTILVSVPKVFERSYARIQEDLKTAPRKARWVARAAALGFRVHQGTAAWTDRLRARLYDLVIGRAVRRRLGGRLRYVFLGGAPASPALLSFFTGMGLHFLQGYGLTETAPVISCNRLADRDLRSVGRLLPAIELRFANDEICVRGPSVMQGYWHRPEATAQIFDGDGFLHTGDLGRLENGLLYITGRAKDLIVLSNGEKVAPADAEQAILQDPTFEQALVVGEGHGELLLLAVSALTDEQALRDRANAQLHAFPGYTRITRVLRVKGPWTTQNGFLTPTLKVRRQWIEARYQAEIAACYQEAGHDSPPTMPL
ncbi:MAG TPA: AMP-binding protein [Acidiferrobacter sp.]|nr:AMP-binding protein [Acidiferrobacter sp.]